MWTLTTINYFRYPRLFSAYHVKESAVSSFLEGKKITKNTQSNKKEINSEKGTFIELKRLQANSLHYIASK